MQRLFGYGKLGGGGYLTTGEAEPVGPDITAPAAPTGLAVVAGAELNTLTWTDPADGDLAGIRVYRSTTSGSGHTLINTVSPGIEEYVDSELTSGTTYYYVLTAIDEVPNESSATSEESGTPITAEFWRDPVVAASSVFDPAYYDWEAETTGPATVNLERGQVTDPLTHDHCPQAVTDGWAGRVEITTAQDPNTVINANPQGTVFVLKAGTHPNRHITALRPGDILVGESGSVLDGSGISGVDAASTRAIYTLTGQGTIVYNVKVENYPLYDDSTLTPPGEAVLVRGGRIINCEVNDCGPIGIKMEGPDTIVRFNIVRRCRRLNYSGGSWWEEPPHPDTMGYHFEYNESEDAHVFDEFDQSWEAAHKWVDISGFKFRFNYFHGFRGFGIWFDGDVDDPLIEYNVCTNGERSGIHFEIASRATIRYNTIEDCASGYGGIFISNSDACDVHHNYLRWNTSSIRVTDEPSRDPAGRNNTIHHNVVYQELIPTGAGEWGLGKVGIHYSPTTDGHLPAATNNVWHDNTYYVDDGAGGSNLTSTELFMWLPESHSGDAGEMNFTSWSALAGEVGSTIQYEAKPGPAVVNLLDPSVRTDFSAWTPVGTPTITVNSTNAPDATLTADTVGDDDSGGHEGVSHEHVLGAGAGTYTFSIYILKTGASGPCANLTMRYRQGGVSDQANMTIDPFTGAFQRTGFDPGDMVATIGVEDEGSWWRAWITAEKVDSLNENVRIEFYPARTVSVSGGITSSQVGSLVLWGAQLNSGALAAYAA